MSWDLPTTGVVFWPVGNGDAITVAIDAATVIQIDINHREVHDDEDDDRVPVADRLVEVLPRKGDHRPYLSVLAITHHDLDHCSGFSRLCEDIDVEEMWITLRSFVEDKNKDELHDAGAAIYEEAKRRRDKEIEAFARGERAAKGDRLIVIGYADLLNDEDWTDFPEELAIIPGNFLNAINGEDRSAEMEIFIHTPFRSDTEDGSRNSSSLGIQLTLHAGECEKAFLLLGDLEYEQVEAFVDRSVEGGHKTELEWDVLLAPHHGSRTAIRHKVLDKWEDARALTDLAEHAREGARVVISSRAFGSASDADTDPPHEDARDAYIGIVGKANLYSTADYANGSDSEPLTFVVEEGACGEIRSKTAFAQKLATLSVISQAEQIRPGDQTGTKRDQEFG